MPKSTPTFRHCSECNSLLSNNCRGTLCRDCYLKANKKPEPHCLACGKVLWNCYRATGLCLGCFKKAKEVLPTEPCSICNERVAVVKGMCRMCYQRSRKGGVFCSECGEPSYGGRCSKCDAKKRAVDKMKHPVVCECGNKLGSGNISGLCATCFSKARKLVAPREINYMELLRKDKQK
jgi:hypothetical protein